MTLSLYDISIPAFVRGLTNLSDILKKGVAYANEKGIPSSKLLEARLAPDMAALPFQIQSACDTARRSVTRVGGVEDLSLPGTEKTFEELEARIQKSIAYLKSVDSGAYDGKEGTIVRMPYPGQMPASSDSLGFSVENYLLGFSLPNFYFHVTTAYAILRSQGVPLGKFDYLQRVPPA